MGTACTYLRMNVRCPLNPHCLVDGVASPVLGRRPAPHAGAALCPDPRPRGWTEVIEQPRKHTKRIVTCSSAFVARAASLH